MLLGALSHTKAVAAATRSYTSVAMNMPYKVSTCRSFEPSIDLLLNVGVILNVFVRSLVGQLIEQAAASFPP